MVERLIIFGRKAEERWDVIGNEKNKFGTEEKNDKEEKIKINNGKILEKKTNHKNKFYVTKDQEIIDKTPIKNKNNKKRKLHQSLINQFFKKKKVEKEIISQDFNENDANSQHSKEQIKDEQKDQIILNQDFNGDFNEDESDEDESDEEIKEIEKEQFLNQNFNEPETKLIPFCNEDF
jgi:hypothetical protein